MSQFMITGTSGLVLGYSHIWGNTDTIGLSEEGKTPSADTSSAIFFVVTAWTKLQV